MWIDRCMSKLVLEILGCWTLLAAPVSDFMTITDHVNIRSW